LLVLLKSGSANEGSVPHFPPQHPLRREVASRKSFPAKTHDCLRNRSTPISISECGGLPPLLRCTRNSERNQRRVAAACFNSPSPPSDRLSGATKRRRIDPFCWLRHRLPLPLARIVARTYIIERQRRRSVRPHNPQGTSSQFAYVTHRSHKRFPCEILYLHSRKNRTQSCPITVR